MPSSWQNLRDKPKFQHVPLLGSMTTKPRSDSPTPIISSRKPPFSQESPNDLQSVNKGSEDYSHITTDEIRFLRELKKQFEQVEAIQGNQAAANPSSPSGTVSHGKTEKRSQENQAFNETTSNMTIKKLMRYIQSKSNRVATADASQGKSLRNVLQTAKPLPGISRLTENWLPRDQFEGLASDCPELSRTYHDGPTPKIHYSTTPLGDVFFRPSSTEYHPFSQAAKSPVFKRLVISTGRFWNPRANISLSGFWVTENLFITALNFHPWAPSTTVKSLHDQIEDFKSRNDGIELFVSNNRSGANDSPETIKVVLRAWDTSIRIAVFRPEDKERVSPNFVGVDMLIEEDAAYGYNETHIATVGYNPLNMVGDDPLGSRLLTPVRRSVTFGEITISEGHRENKINSPPVFARLESGFSHGSYGRMCITMEANQRNSGFIIGLGIYEANSSNLSLFL